MQTRTSYNELKKRTKRYQYEQRQQVRKTTRNHVTDAGNMVRKPAVKVNVAELVAWRRLVGAMTHGEKLVCGGVSVSLDVYGDTWERCYRVSYDGQYWKRLRVQCRERAYDAQVEIARYVLTLGCKAQDAQIDEWGVELEQLSLW